jgi:hypothetical protein
MQVSRWDDYLIHQIAQPIDTVGTHDENFMDRLWFMAHTEDGSLQMMAGLGVYPNKGLTDAFLLIRNRGIQHNFRAYRHIEGDRSVARIGPLSFDIVVPQQHWRVVLANNENGIACWLDFQARVAPFLFPELGFKQQEQMHYKQPGRCEGTLTVAGEKFPVSAMPSVRDRSWGVRQPGLIANIGTLIVIEAHFDSISATLIYIDSQHFRMRQGALLFDDGSVIPIVEIRQHVAFDRRQLVHTVRMELQSESGQTWKLSALAISDPCYFSGGGYDGRQGADRGPLHIEGEQWDVSADGDVRAVFPYYSRIVELDLNGERGIGHVEAFISPRQDWVYEATLTD